MAPSGSTALPLSVVIPTRNEAGTLPGLLADLASQEGIALEVVVVDGGSRDGTRERCAAAAFPVHLVESPPGRGRQMNRGAAAARGEDLLFLHADTRLADRGLLARAREAMDRERARRGSHRVAGHFPLRFVRADPGPSAAYYFYEAKTRLNRMDCVHGDQGMWMGRGYFQELGGFDEALPYLEDVRLARRVFETGTWTTLPGWAASSARRFEAEGLRRRQTLNALLHNFEAVGLHRFFDAAREAYRSQERAGPLPLRPFLALAHRVGREEGWGPFLRYWLRTGRYVAANGWQLAFAADCLRNRRRGVPPGEGPTAWLERYDRWAAPWVTSPAGSAAAAALAALWFYGSWLVER
ncbi:MAG: TIGR04283 family arsenosugar biosynthesis glycosyltransferase [Deferrisomatales bacterium]